MPSHKASSPSGTPRAPALPNTGQVLEVNRNGTFTVFAAGLNQPTSLEIIGNTAFVVTLGGRSGRSTGCRDGLAGRVEQPERLTPVAKDPRRGRRREPRLHSLPRIGG